MFYLHCQQRLGCLSSVSIDGWDRETPRRGEASQPTSLSSTYILERNWSTRCHPPRPVPSYPVLHYPSLAGSDAGYDGDGDVRDRDRCPCSLSVRKKLVSLLTSPPSWHVHTIKVCEKHTNTHVESNGNKQT